VSFGMGRRVVGRVGNVDLYLSTESLLSF